LFEINQVIKVNFGKNGIKNFSSVPAPVNLKDFK